MNSNDIGSISQRRELFVEKMRAMPSLGYDGWNTKYSAKEARKMRMAGHSTEVLLDLRDKWMHKYVVAKITGSGLDREAARQWILFFDDLLMERGLSAINQLRQFGHARSSEL